jgi:hypothetical protein
MIDINTAANIAEIAGGIAILVSLIYVGYQIRQSNRIASAAALQSVLEGFSDRNVKDYLDHPEIMGVLARGHHCHDDLDALERTIFNSWLNREIFQMQNVRQLRDNRLINEVEHQTWLAYTAAQVKSPGGKAAWDSMKVSYSPTIIESIEGYLEANVGAPSIIELYPGSHGEEARAIKGKPIA